MGVKIPTIAISTLTLLAGVFAPTMAWADETEQTEWTYAEMAALNAEVESELNANCESNDPMCRAMYIGMNKTGDIYSALSLYRLNGVTVTAVNPSAHTIKVAYDSDVISDGGTRLLLKDLYISQVEQGYFAGAFAAAIDEEDNAALEHLRVLFFKNNATNTDDWFPHGSELEIQAPNLALSAPFSQGVSAEGYQTQLSVFYRVAVTNSSWGTSFDLSSCFASPEYQEGMECRIMYAKNHYFYTPVEVEAPVTEQESADVTDGTNNSAIENSENAADTGYGGAATAAMAAAEASAAAMSAAAASATGATPDMTAGTSAGVSISTANTGNGSTSAPDTGTMTGNYEENVTEFPWWLGAIFAVGITTLIRFFLPVGHKAHRNGKKIQKI